LLTVDRQINSQEIAADSSAAISSYESLDRRIKFKERKKYEREYKFTAFGHAGSLVQSKFHSSMEKPNDVGDVPSIPVDGKTELRLNMEKTIHAKKQGPRPRSIRRAVQ
jgi:hypothetical protein